MPDDGLWSILQEDAPPPPAPGHGTLDAAVVGGGDCRTPPPTAGQKGRLKAPHESGEGWNSSPCHLITILLDGDTGWPAFITYAAEAEYSMTQIILYYTLSSMNRTAKPTRNDSMAIERYKVDAGIMSHVRIFYHSDV